MTCPQCEHCAAPRRGLLGRASGRVWVAAVVAMLFAGVSIAGARSSRVGSTRLKLKSIENALRQYSIDNRYPTQEEGLMALLHPPGCERAYLEEYPLDMWGNAIVYVTPARRGDGAFEVFSAGPDGVVGTEDDVYSRKKRRR